MAAAVGEQVDVREQPGVDHVDVGRLHPRLDHQGSSRGTRLRIGSPAPTTPPSVRSFSSTTSPATGA